jgi:hypothetical protein
MTSTAPATAAQRLTRRTEVTRSFFDSNRSVGVTRLFKGSVFVEPRVSEAFAVVSWDAVAGKASAVAATSDACEAFDGESLSAVLALAFEWAEQEAAR